eukprot:gene27852-36682_t
MSCRAVNHPTERSCNLATLEASSDCDSLLLEMRLALELHTRDQVEKIYPVFIGDRTTIDSNSPDSSSKSITSLVDATSVAADDTYAHYFKSGCHPQFSNDDVVASVESQVRAHLERMCLGCPLMDEMSTAAVLKAIVKSQGQVVDGAIGPAFSKVYQDILKMHMQHEQLLQKEQQHLITPSNLPKSVRSAAVNMFPSDSSVLSSVSRDSSSHKGVSYSSATPSTQSPSEINIAEMFRYLQECGLRRSKCRQYAEKLVVSNQIESPKILHRMYDNMRLMSILNSVMDRQDAEIVSKKIFNLRRAEKGRYRSPDRHFAPSNNGVLLPALGRNELLHQIESVPSQLPSLAYVAPMSTDALLPKRQVFGMRRKTFDA